MEKVLKPKDMINLVAEDTGYLKYEVEDVLLSFYKVLHKAIVAGHEIRFTNTMTLEAAHVPVRQYWCTKDKMHKTSKGKRTLKVRAFQPLERDLQNNPLKDNSNAGSN